MNDTFGGKKGGFGDKKTSTASHSASLNALAVRDGSRILAYEQHKSIWHWCEDFAEEGQLGFHTDGEDQQKAFRKCVKSACAFR